jgi:hypothetical protein
MRWPGGTTRRAPGAAARTAAPAAVLAAGKRPPVIPEPLREVTG